MANSALTETLTQEGDEGVSVKIFPLIADPDTTFPFLIYRRSSYTPDNTKDYRGEKVYLEFYVCCSEYSESVRIMNMVADTLRGKETQTIDDIQITNLYEDFIYDSYVQIATMEVTLKD